MGAGAKGIPIDSPKFSKRDLVRAIPPHCFVRSDLISFAYLAADLVGVMVLTYIAYLLPTLPPSLELILWPVYWVLQGGVLTGLWVIAHECGHRAFSDSVFICDVVGLVLHSILLVPYHGWRISHAKHHRSTGDIERDEAFVPLRLSEVRELKKDENPTLLMLVINTFLMFAVGWWVYLCFHTTGRKYERHTDHFNPSSPLFGPKHYWMIILSDFAILFVLASLVLWGWLTSWQEVVLVYGVPYLIVNFWLLLYTLLHHTDPKIPRYSSEKWDWLLGALSTVDRDYGFLWNTLHHHIGDTHVLHHLFSKIPHYHAQEATEAIKPILGEYYYASDEGITSALWKVIKTCQYVDDTQDKDVYWFAPEEKQKL